MGPIRSLGGVPGKEGRGLQRRLARTPLLALCCDLLLTAIQFGAVSKHHSRCQLVYLICLNPGCQPVDKFITLVSSPFYKGGILYDSIFVLHPCVHTGQASGSPRLLWRQPEAQGKSMLAIPRSVFMRSWSQTLLPCVPFWQ